MKHSGLRFMHYKNHKFYNHIAEAKWHSGVVRLNTEFVGEAIHTETKEKYKVYKSIGKDEYLYLSPLDIGTLTIYQADYNDLTYGDKAILARPEEMFWGDVEIEDGDLIPRFRLIQADGFAIK